MGKTLGNNCSWMSRPLLPKQQCKQHRRKVKALASEPVKISHWLRPFFDHHELLME